MPMSSRLTSQVSPVGAELVEALARTQRHPRRAAPGELLRVGVDLGTAYVVVSAVDQAGRPRGCAMRFAKVVRDGLVVDYWGAIRIVKELVVELETSLGARLREAATGYPPGVPVGEVEATRHVVEAAGLGVRAVVPEPVAANTVLGITDGMIADVGGGTTGIALFREGQVAYLADEPTGGHHFTLVVAGALGLSYEEAEAAKTEPKRQGELFPVVRPVMQKVASIISRHAASGAVPRIYLVGGATAFPGFAEVITEETRIQAVGMSQPMLVTPLGIALSVPQARPSVPGRSSSSNGLQVTGPRAPYAGVPGEEPGDDTSRLHRPRHPATARAEVFPTAVSTRG
jgi:ethanolamine utilization protein EutJ